MLRGRLSPDAMFPAGDERFRVSYLAVLSRQSQQKIRVVECGPVDAQDVVMCVHGWGCSVYSYRDILPPLAARGIRAIAIDLLGHGLSDKPEATGYYTLDALVTMVGDVCTQLALPPATFVGHSMGSLIAARYAVRYPHAVRALILTAPVGFGMTFTMKTATVCTPSIVAPLLPYLSTRAVTHLCLRMSYGRLRTLSARDIDEYWAPTQFPAFVRVLRILLHTFDWFAAPSSGLDQIAVPTTIVRGTLDPLVPPETVRGYTALIAHARVIEVEGCGHTVPEEAPAHVLQALREIAC
jgi:4,5:9,10-diseco-3-hydroxy-5,9,17-trioxoandrosta-1(10),2-diene-4-oate hydrolase